MFFTFYSFRGGVGQSLALANAAYLLAMNGRRVLVVDLAFQAPCLPGLVGLQAGYQRGVIDRVEEHLQGSAPTPLSELVKYGPRPREMTGELLVLPAGGGRGGSARRNPDIPWDSLYRMRQGYLFFENLRGAIQGQLQPDLVLIDAGSGPADPAGVAVMQLADALVLFFCPSNLGLETLSEGCEYMPADGPRARGPRERVVVISPMPAAAEDTIERCLKGAARSAGALKAIAIPYAPSQAWNADGRIQKSRPGEAITQAYRALADWLDGSGLNAQGFRIRVESQARRPASVRRLLQRVHAPSAAVLDAFREALVNEISQRQSGEPLSRTVARSQVPFVWRVASAQALLEQEGIQVDEEQEVDPLQDALALHQVRYLSKIKMSREAEGEALVALSTRLTGVTGARVLLDAVRSLKHRGGDIPLKALFTVLERVVAEGEEGLSGEAVRLASSLPRRYHEPVADWLASLKLREGMDGGALIDAFSTVGAASPTKAARSLVELWTGSPSQGFPYRPALAALRKLLESHPEQLGPLLVEEGSRLLAMDFENGWRDYRGRSALWYVLAPAHRGSALIGLVEDALSQWLVVGHRRAVNLLDGLLTMDRSVTRWVSLGALPLAPKKQRRRIIDFVRQGFFFPPPGGMRRWDAAGVAWGSDKGPSAPSEDPVAVGLVEGMTRSGLRPPSGQRACSMLSTLGDQSEKLPNGLVLATIHHALSAEEKLPTRLAQQAEKVIFANLPHVAAVEALVDLVRHRDATPALTVALNQLIGEQDDVAVSVSNGLVRLSESQPDLALELAEHFLEKGVPLGAWAGLLRLVEGKAGRTGRKQTLLERVMTALADAEVTLPPSSVQALEGAIHATIALGRKLAIRQSRRILTSPLLPQAARRRICRALASLLGVAREGRRVERLLGQMLEHSEPSVRSAAALAAVEGALAATPNAGLPQDILQRMADEVEQDRPALDVIYALLHYLVGWSSNLPGSVVSLVAKVMIPTSPAVAEPQLVSLAMDALSRILRAATVEPQFLEAARTLRDALREGGMARLA